MNPSDGVCRACGRWYFVDRAGKIPNHPGRREPDCDGGGFDPCDHADKTDLGGWWGCETCGVEGQYEEGEQRE